MRWKRFPGMVILVLTSCLVLSLGLMAGCGDDKGGSSDFTVKASVKGGSGTVDPGTQAVPPGGSASIDIKPDAGYHIASITDNGDSVEIADPYVIGEVTEDHEVEVVFGEGAAGGAGGCPDEPEAFTCAIVSQVVFEEFAWEDSGTAGITVSPTIDPYIPTEDLEGDIRAAGCGVSGEGELTLYGEGPGYSCSGTNVLLVEGYCLDGQVYLSVTVTSNGTITAGPYTNAFTETYAYDLDFDIAAARSGECVVTVPVESGTTTWSISPA
jgi:hypothetical protein